MQFGTKTKLGAAGLCAAALVIGLSTPASADVQPTATDATAVGSDTVQYIVDFLADGDASAHGGYNLTHTARRIISFDATADANGRAAYNNAGGSLSPTIVLRAGTKPVTRPNGSGAGITALLNDTNHLISFVRSSRLPSQTEQNNAAGFGGIHVYKIANDGLQVAVRSAGSGGTNAPASLSGTDLVNIYNGTYKKWSDVPGYSGPAPNDGIVPVLPQTGSGTRNDFLADLQNNFNGGTAISLGANVVTGEEHDPVGITGITNHTDTNGNPVTAADGISPFSTGRNNLINSGYFGTSPAPNTISLLGGSSYILNRQLYILCRENDVNSATPFQVGGSLNFVKELFGTATSWFGRPQNSALFTSAGVTQSWQDLGLAHS